MIEIKGLEKQYKNENIIKYKDYTFEDGKSYLLLGASGCGKSTLLNMICGLLSPTNGEILIDKVDFTKLKQKDKDAYRIKNIGYIYQDFKLINQMTVLDNINILNIEGISTKGVNDLLDNLGILDKKNKKITNLSGGEKQRVAIARALVKAPSLILADEPTGNLNFEIGEEVCKKLLEVSKGHTLIVVSHDERLKKYFDYTLDMSLLISKEAI